MSGIQGSNAFSSQFRQELETKLGGGPRQVTNTARNATEVPRPQPLPTTTSPKERPHLRQIAVKTVKSALVKGYTYTKEQKEQDLIDRKIGKEAEKAARLANPPPPPPKKHLAVTTVNTAFSILSMF